MRAKIKGAFLMPELVVLSAMLVFAGIAAADDGLNLVGGIADELLLLSDDESCPSVLYIPELATIAAPLVSILGLLLFFNHRKLREEN